MGVVGMTASLAACGDSGSSSAAASSTAGGDDGVITISYWTTDRHDQAYLTPLIEEYNKTNPDNIYIDYQVYADNYSQMLDLAFSTDTAPDVSSSVERTRWKCRWTKRRCCWISLRI